MGRDYYSVETGVREIAAELRSESRLRRFNSEKERRNREWARAHKLLRAQCSVDVYLTRDVLSVEQLRSYLSNFRLFPEIRHHAAEILYRAYPDTARISRRRQLLINQLNAVIREFKEAK